MNDTVSSHPATQRRHLAQMVAEDDPAWLRFWEVFPWRTTRSM